MHLGYGQFDFNMVFSFRIGNIWAKPWKIAPITTASKVQKFVKYTLASGFATSQPLMAKKNYDSQKVEHL